MGIPLRRGRRFTARDNSEGLGVAIISEQAARRFFPNEDPIGKRLMYFRAPSSRDKFEIVGVVGDVKHGSLTEEARPAIYRHAPQLSLRSWMDVVVRTEGDPESLIAAARDAVRAVDLDQPVYNIRTMEQRLARSIAANRFNALLLGLFASVAMMLAVGGVYGVMSYTVTQSSHEIGVRMALGARRGNVLSLVVRRGMRLTLFGASLGVAVALALTRIMKNLLFNVSATDPTTFAFITLLLMGVALLACYIPARRATKVDPMTALRFE